MAAQALSGIAKDLTKMSAKSAIKVLVPENARPSLFKWVAVLTARRTRSRARVLPRRAAALASLGLPRRSLGDGGRARRRASRSMLSLPPEMGKAKAKAKFRGLLSKTREVNVLSAARFFLFGARDIWFVVGVPVFLCDAPRLGLHRGRRASSRSGSSATASIQSLAPASHPPLDATARRPQGRAAQVLAFAPRGASRPLIALGLVSARAHRWPCSSAGSACSASSSPSTRRSTRT